ncbi:hypothetical protein Rxycam_02706 [Rubrobacter xylanophilus DSM 9941]|uniref:hypothetical protein n=1 Tax=Rubrobacter xylanophilus TaxID=49319 RepID=UPI001C63E3AF|nr:hypothetical protein [Rubrobacter xylanophilus]QYJ16870.1 hypothetical protein Rxycam_02706 [Rubrobacter xylanophilus DSM 9941]
MEIREEGRAGLVYTWQACVLCGAPFGLFGEARVHEAYGEGGEPIGRVCPGCVGAGAEGLAERLRERARRLRERAGWLEGLVEEGVRFRAAG